MSKCHVNEVSPQKQAGRQAGVSGVSWCFPSFRREVRIGEASYKGGLVAKSFYSCIILNYGNLHSIPKESDGADMHHFIILLFFVYTFCSLFKDSV